MIACADGFAGTRASDVLMKERALQTNTMDRLEKFRDESLCLKNSTVRVLVAELGENVAKLVFSCLGKTQRLPGALWVGSQHRPAMSPMAGMACEVLDLRSSARSPAGDVSSHRAGATS